MATGINVSKANAYAVLSPPKGIVVSKAVVYAVLAPPSTVLPVWGGWAFPDGIVGVPYSLEWDMPASTSPMTYTLVSGALPDGLSLTDEAGCLAKISGTPTVAGAFSFTLRADNSAGSTDKAFSITISAAPSGEISAFVWIS